MNMAPSKLEARDTEDPWREQLNAIQTSDRHHQVESIVTSALLALAVVVEASSMLHALRPTISSAAGPAASALPVLAGAVALICACYIAFSLHRRRRDVVRNDIQDLRLQIKLLAAREEAKAPDAAESGSDR